MDFVTSDDPTPHPAYGFAPMTRLSLEEPDQIACLRGVVEELEAERRNPARPGSGLSEWRQSLRAELEAQGYTLESAKRLVYPEPEKLPVAYRRVNRIPRRHPTPTAQRSARAPRTSQSPAPSSAPVGTAAAAPDQPPVAEEDPAGPGGDWANLPPVLAVEHLATLFGVSVASARRHIVAGDYGPRFKLGRRWHLRTEDLRAHLGELAERESRPGRTDDAAVRRWQKRLADQRRRAKRGRRR